MNGHLDIIRYLAEFVDPTTPVFPEEEALIFRAIYNRQPEVVKLLANLSKNLPTPLTKAGSTPIEVAEFLGHNEIVEILKIVEEARSGC